jgi:hypothetical protein
MKKGILPGLVGFLMLLLGGMALLSDGALSTFMASSSVHSLTRAMAFVPAYLAIPPMVGWFVSGMGAVLTGLTLHERKIL